MGLLKVLRVLGIEEWYKSSLLTFTAAANSYTQWRSQGWEWLGTGPTIHVWCPTNPHIYCAINTKVISISFHNIVITMSSIGVYSYCIRI